MKSTDPKFKAMPAAIRSHYETQMQDVASVRALPTQGRGPEGYNVTMTALGAVDRWRFRGAVGARRWVIV